jgi:hypothetical protein
VAKKQGEKTVVIAMGKEELRTLGRVAGKLGPLGRLARR